MPCPSNPAAPAVLSSRHPMNQAEWREALAAFVLVALLLVYFGVSRARGPADAVARQERQATKLRNAVAVKEAPPWATGVAQEPAPHEPRPASARYVRVDGSEPQAAR